MSSWMISWCFCPQCKRGHYDLVKPDDDRENKRNNKDASLRQECDRCAILRMSPEQRKVYATARRHHFETTGNMKYFPQWLADSISRCADARRQPE